MPSLKDLRLRIRSVKSTQKITSAMKMVAAAKLRRAQEQAEAARPYADRLGRMIGSLAGSFGPGEAPALLVGNDSPVHLVLFATADRGLCGAFNTSIVRETRAMIRELEAAGRQVKLLPIGRKGRDLLRKEFGDRYVDTLDFMGKKKVGFADVETAAVKVRQMFDAGEIGAATIIFARFKSAISQIVSRRQLIPATIPEAKPSNAANSAQAGPQALYEYEPDEEQILQALLPRNLSVQIYTAVLENFASEHGARMTAMDNATRNAGDMINKLTLNYNRQRQATITKELIEIISGAEAV
ncbi:MAG: F0F1 ATP synthase subunit gamma [Alphaproteobacteria bacterium]|nr:MAG: F0F1 ATP synthase subunit gamma [Alphaproteobacteria bacterium]